MENLNPFVPTHVLYTNIGTPEETRTELAGFEPYELNTDPDQREGGLGFYNHNDWHSGERCSDWSLDGDGYLCFQGSRLITHCGAYKLVRIEDDVQQFECPLDYAHALCEYGYAIVADYVGGYAWAIGRTLEDVAREWNENNDDAQDEQLDPDSLYAGHVVRETDGGEHWYVVGLSEGAYWALSKDPENSPSNNRVEPLVYVWDEDYLATYGEVVKHGLAVKEDKYRQLCAAKRKKDADSISTSAVG